MQQCFAHEKRTRAVIAKQLCFRKLWLCTSDSGTSGDLAQLTFSVQLPYL